METTKLTALEARIAKATEKLLIPIEKMEEEYAKLHDIAVAKGTETWEDRKAAQKPQCSFGEEGVCCRICSMGPCRITKKASRGICGCDVHGIVARNYLRFSAGGTAAHSDHGREIMHTFSQTAADKDYQVKDVNKLLKIATDWEVETEGRDIYDIAHEVAEIGLLEYGKVHGTQRFIKWASKDRQEAWAREGIEPRAIDREIAECLHRTHMGCSSEPIALMRQALRSALSDGWGGSMMGTEFSDIMFGTPMPRDTEANLGVLDADCVNIIVHGHDPSLSEMIVKYAEDPEMIALAKEVGAKGINIAGVCCTSNEVTMRHGIPMAGNFLQQENCILTGAVEAVVVDIQCIFPALGPLSQCFHTKFITTSEIARIPYATHIPFDVETAGTNAKAIVKEAVENFKNRDASSVYIPDMKRKATVGYSCEAIIKQLDTVTNSFVDETGTYQPLVDCITSGVIRGAVAVVGCNNPKVRTDFGHIELMKKMLANDCVIVLSGCSAQAAAKAGLMSKEAKDICGAGMKRVCELADIPPVLHMGSCVDISRMMRLVCDVATQWGVDVPQMPVVGCAPEWMSEKAVSIGNYVVATGIDTFLGVVPYVGGSDIVSNFLQDGIKEWVGASFTFETDMDKLGDLMLENIEAKRLALGI